MRTVSVQSVRPLLSQGELIHVANYISLPVAPKDYNMAEAIKLRGSAHSFEGKVFTVFVHATTGRITGGS